MWKILTAVLAFAIAALATSASASTDQSPMYSVCDGVVTEIPDIRPCPDGYIRIVR